MVEGHADRQLLAIMFTDVVGYTAITERDEASAVRIREAHRNLVSTRASDPRVMQSASSFVTEGGPTPP